MFSAREGKGQGSLEYLLLLGGAVVVSVTVIVLLMSISTETSSAIQEQLEAFKLAATEPGWYMACFVPHTTYIITPDLAPIPPPDLTLTFAAPAGFGEGRAGEVSVVGFDMACKLEKDPTQALYGEITQSQPAGVHTLTYKGWYHGTDTDFPDCDGGYIASSSDVTVSLSSSRLWRFYYGDTTVEQTSFSNITIPKEGFPTSLPQDEAGVTALVTEINNGLGVCVIWFGG